MLCGRLCHILSFVFGKCFWHFARPAIFDSQLLDQNRDFCLYPTCIRRPRRRVPVGISPPRLVRKNYNGVATRWWKKFRRYVYWFWHHPRTWQTDRRTDGHRMTAVAALMLSIARQKASLCLLVKWIMLFQTVRLLYKVGLSFIPFPLHAQVLWVCIIAFAL